MILIFLGSDSMVVFLIFGGSDWTSQEFELNGALVYIYILNVAGLSFLDSL